MGLNMWERGRAKVRELNGLARQRERKQKKVTEVTKGTKGTQKKES